MKNLKRFNLSSEYQEFLAGGIERPNVSLVENAWYVHYFPDNGMGDYYTKNEFDTILSNLSTYADRVFGENNTIINLVSGNAISYQNAVNITKISQLTNDAGFLKASDISRYITGVTETDPTVKSWAKTSNKPTYTASEVGALSTSTTLDGVNDGSTRKLSALMPKSGSKVLVTNDYTTTDKNKLAAIAASAQVNTIESIKVNGTAQPISSKAVNITVPTKISQVTNNSGFINSSTTKDFVTTGLVKTQIESYGYTNKTGTITGVQMNGSSKVSNGVANLGTVVQSFKVNDSAATVSNGVASLTIIIPTGLPEVSPSDNGKVLKVVNGSIIAAYDKPDYTKIPFTIEALGSGNITWALSGKTVQYSKNGGSWETMDSETTISVVEGDEVQFNGTNTDYYNNAISTTTQFNVKGNIMSLTDGNDFETADTVNASAFRGLFAACTYLISASDLKLPATTLATYCYAYMFRDCTSLTTAPELPTATLADYCCQNMFRNCTSLTTSPELPTTSLAAYCYDYMFYGCTGLTTAPELPATTAAPHCYSNMFWGCTSLTTAPELPATTLTANCYAYMFYGCTNLTTAPELPATTLATYCYAYMFCNCTSLTTAPELPATTLATHCYENMFRECTGLTTAPEELPATTLADNCYGFMFYNCTSLTTVPEKLPATTLANNCYRGMFRACTNITTAPELPATTLVSYCYYYMFYDCKKLNYIKAMFLTTPSTTLTGNWVNGVASTGTFVKNASASWANNGANSIPTSWTIQTATS